MKGVWSSLQELAESNGCRWKAKISLEIKWCVFSSLIVWVTRFSEASDSSWESKQNCSSHEKSWTLKNCESNVRGAKIMLISFSAAWVAAQKKRVEISHVCLRRTCSGLLLLKDTVSWRIYGHGENDQFFLSLAISEHFVLDTGALWKIVVVVMKLIFSQHEFECS